jgi:hemerythrin-like domain-containing protein
METGTLGAALEREHREIDSGIEAFTAGLSQGKTDTEPLLHAMSGLRRHIYLEEVFLFPPLRGAGLMIQIFAMLREHGELWDTMASIDGLLAEQAADDAVLSACKELLAQLDKHNTIEEPVIYPHADEVLTAEASGELKAFLDAGQMPEDWVCAKAKAKG